MVVKDKYYNKLLLKFIEIYQPLTIKWKFTKFLLKSKEEEK